MYNVILCGLGAVGITYASKFVHKDVSLKILADENRIKRYTENKPKFNGIPIDFDYIMPDSNFEADLIIIATKYQGLESAISYIKNFVTEHTIIISLINGVTSEDIIKGAYPQAKVLKSYFIGHSAMRKDNDTWQDGIGTIVIEHDEYIEKLFDMLDVEYEVPDDINYSMWLKYAFNTYANPISAILNITFGDMKNNTYLLDLARCVVKEVKQVAQKMGISRLDNLEADAINSLYKMCDDGKTSMLQDILACRNTEIDLFCGEIIRLGQKYGIDTPYNQELYNLVKIKENINEHSIHTC